MKMLEKYHHNNNLVFSLIGAEEMDFYQWQ